MFPLSKLGTKACLISRLMSSKVELKVTLFHFRWYLYRLATLRKEPGTPTELWTGSCITLTMSVIKL